jgi:hypothetical protein
MTPELSDEDFALLWRSDETEDEITARLGIGHDKLVAAWRRLGFIAPTKNRPKTEGIHNHDGRPSLQFEDALLDKLRKGFR